MSAPEEFLGKVEDFLDSLLPLYFLPEGIYIISEDKRLSNKILLFLDGQNINFVYLTGPLSISKFSKILYRILNLNKLLRGYIRKLNESIKARLKTPVTLQTITYIDYSRFFVDLVVKYFGASLEELSKTLKDIEGILDHLVEAKTLIIDEYYRAKEFVNKWNLKKYVYPAENRIRIFTREGVFEYKSSSLDYEKIKVFSESKSKVMEKAQIIKIFLLSAYWELEKRRLLYIEAAANILDKVLNSKQNVVVALARKLERDGNFKVTVDLGGKKVDVGLRVNNGIVYICINTGEYIVKETVNPRYFSGPAVYVYFPPVDICVELKQEKIDSKTIIYPAEAPVMLDPYLHPSVDRAYGVRSVCLGDKNYYVTQLVNAAKEIAKGKDKVTIDDFGLIITSTEQALAEILRTTFWVMRYGYRRGAKPHKYATECAGRFGAKLITNISELENYRRRGVEIIGD